jgi:hypothetical protein
MTKQGELLNWAARYPHQDNAEDGNRQSSIFTTSLEPEKQSLGRAKITPKRILSGIVLAALAGVGWAAPVPAAALLAAPVTSAGATDFSGIWVLNVMRSDFAGETPPSSKMQQVEHKEGELVVTIDEIGERGTVHGVARYAIDGQDSINDVLGHPMTSSISWDGAVMIMRTWGRFGNTDIMLVDRWSLSPDGKTLTIAREFHGHGQIIHQTLVFDRK